MDKAFLENLFSKSSKAKIFVLGDIMLDRYLFGDVNRISPEAPVQVFDIRRSESRLGGAANVAFNISTLGSNPFLIGVTGEDSEAEVISEQLKQIGVSSEGIIREANRPTTSKTRVISDSHHLIRIDSESREDISQASALKIVSLISENSSADDVLILQDYNKGVLSKCVIDSVLTLSREKGLRVLVDPKFDNFFEFWEAFLFKPNKKELEDALGRKAKELSEIHKLAEDAMERLKCSNMVLTLGEHGMLILETSGGELKKEVIATKARKVADVSGAGDTVISAIAVCLAGGASVRDAAVISNYAAGIVVEEVGIVPVYKDALITHITGGTL